ncbi:hypothetical protein M3612_17875 [Niallia taxi]|uniref:hypothetical protein n=1 Tax=Niallia taxi TaxID=2499688 RepID=UPI0020412120|nr:hypothetical protein [Niallia taxi]MCM3216356.1 hypothetical protein [Niallia taxi]
MGLQISFQVDPGVNIASLQGAPTINMLISNLPTDIIDGDVNIDSIQGGKEELFVTISYRKNQEDEYPFKTSNFTFVPSVANNSPNFYEQIYEYMKTQPEFSGAIDVLE